MSFTSESKCQETLIGKLRREFKPRIPKQLESLSTISFSTGEKTTAYGNAKEIEELFPLSYGQPIVDMSQSPQQKNYKVDIKISTEPLRVGVVLSGGQASGGHNVIVGLFDALKN